MSDDALTAVVAAVDAGDEHGARALLADHPEVRTARPEGVSLVRRAAYAQMRALVADLLDAEVPLDVFDAAALDRTDVLQQLLDDDPERRAEVSADGFTPLHLAAFFGQVKATELLLNRGAPAEVVSDNDIAVRPLNAAAAGAHTVVVHLLLDHGADVEARMADGYRPLHAAANNGSAEMVRLLLERGADPNARTDDGRTPLDVAEGDEVREILSSP